MMIDIDGNEVNIGDVVRVLSIDEDLLKNCLTEEERPHHEAMLNNDYVIDDIMEDGRKASVSIQWEEPDGIAIGGLHMLSTEFRLVKKSAREHTYSSSEHNHAGRLGIKAMGSLRKVILIWSVITACLCIAFVFYTESFAADELTMANTLGFRILVSAFVIGVPSLFGLFMVLFFGAIFRNVRCANPAANPEPTSATRLSDK